MGLDTSLLIATGSLANINRQLALVSQNVANANTPDYARGVSQQTSAAAAGQGMGVRSGVVTRDIDLSMQADLFSQNAAVSATATRQGALARIDAAQGAPGGGTDLPSRLGALGDAFSGLRTDPGSAVQQSRVVSTAGDLAGQIRSMAATYASTRQAAQDSLAADVGTLNRTLREIGGLSDRVVRAQAEGTSTAEWENQRDAALTQLSGLVDVRVLRQPSGDLLLLTGASTILPTRGGDAFSLASATLTPVGYYAGPGQPDQGAPGIMLNGTDVTAGLAGGSIGAGLTLRDTTLPGYQAGLDEFAQTLSTRFDQQGLALFTDAAGAVPAPAGPPAQAGYIGYASLIRVNPAVAADATLVRDGTHDVAGGGAGASGFTTNPPGGPAGFSDLVARVTGFALGAQVQPGVAQAPALDTGLEPSGTLPGIRSATGDLAGLATGLVAAQAGDSARANATMDDEATVRLALHTKVTSRSGVKVDTELSMMVQLQASYATTAKLVSAVQTMWNQTLQMVQ